jgi:hypothetical protein
MLVPEVVSVDTGNDQARDHSTVHGQLSIILYVFLSTIFRLSCSLMTIHDLWTLWIPILGEWI